MRTKGDIEEQLAALRLEYRKVYSMLSMMEKGTKLEDLVKMRQKQLDPIQKEIKRLESELVLLTD
jgi:hypothetical protein